MWFLGLSKPERGSEERACVHLLRQGFEVYLPRHRVASGQRRPLFRRYIFVSFDPLTTGWSSIRSTRGMCGLVSFDNSSPARVPESVVDELKRVELCGGLDEVQNESVLKLGAPVRIKDGPLQGWLGKLVGLSSGERCRVLLNLLGGPVVTTLATGHIETIAGSNPQGSTTTP